MPTTKLKAQKPKVKKTPKVPSALPKKMTATSKLAPKVAKSAAKPMTNITKMGAVGKTVSKFAKTVVKAPKSSATVKTAALDTPKPAARKRGGKFASPVVTIGKGPSPDSVCREPACEHLATTGGYCRQCYIKNWKKVKRKELILREKKLNRYIEELVTKYPDKYLDVIRQDLSAEKEFAKVVIDLELDESVDEFESENESVEVIDTIKREFDEDEGF